MRRSTSQSSQSQVDRPQAIAAAQQAIDAIPFAGWPNKEIQDLAVMALVASSMEHGSPGQILELGELLGYVSKALNKALERRNTVYKGLVQRAVYSTTGKLHLERDIDPDALLSALGQDCPATSQEEVR